MSNFQGRKIERKIENMAVCVCTHTLQVDYEEEYASSV